MKTYVLHTKVRPIDTMSTFFFIAVGQFTSPPEGDTIYKGEYRTIEISWMFTLKGKVLINWYFTKRGSSGSGQQIYQLTFNGEKKLNPVQKQFTAGRLDFKGNLNGDNKDATLVINDFTKRDEGVFRCEVQGIRNLKRSINVRAVGMYGVKI